MAFTRSRSSSIISLKTQKAKQAVSGARIQKLKKTTKIEKPGKLLKAEELSDTLTVPKVKKTVSFFYAEAEVEVEKPKHRQVTSACGCCRRRKSKCDGQRPTCGACVTSWTASTTPAKERRGRGTSSVRSNMENVEEFCACITTAKMLCESAAGM
ncbi:hypothetical protein V2W45_1471714 [Cenococcum geophilum]